MTIDRARIETYVEQRRQPLPWTPPEVPYPPGPERNTRLRDYQETLILSRELLDRYRGNAGVPRQILDPVMNRLDQLPPPLTMLDIRTAITNEETAQGVVVTQPTLPDRPFLRDLQLRWGAYTWVGGSTPVFAGWINGPANAAIAKNAQINCWEAVLVSAVLGSALDVQPVRDAYGSTDRTSAVERLLTKDMVERIDLAVAKNYVSPGDIIMLKHRADATNSWVFHVAVATTQNWNDYRQIMVMSLWNAVGGGCFAQAPLSLFLSADDDVIGLKYATLF